MKNIIYILFLFTTFAFSQKEKDTLVINTKAKNLIRNGNKLYNSGNYVAAENEYKKAIELNPNYDKANYNYGNTQFLQNKMKDAKEQYDMVAKTTDDKFIKADSYHNNGNIAMKEKQYAPAVEYYKKALRNNPKDDETRYNLALAQKLLKEQQQKDKDKKDKKEDKDNKDKNKDEKKDKDKKDDKGDEDKKDDKGDKKDDKEKDGDKKDDKEKQDKKEKQQPKPQKSKLSPDQVKQLLEAMNKEENKTQQKMNAKKERGRKVKQEKDW